MNRVRQAKFESALMPESETRGHLYQIKRGLCALVFFFVLVQVSSTINTQWGALLLFLASLFRFISWWNVILSSIGVAN